MADFSSSRSPAFRDVVRFWRAAGPARWFSKSPAFDREFRQRFEAAHMDAAARRLDAWSAEPEGVLALVILLDQFPRNAYRGTAHMLATDPLARAFAQAAVDAGLDQRVDAAMRQFVYLPFEHAEDPQAQERAVALMEPLGQEPLRWALVHRDIIERFGRFPHRNALLGRETSAAEQAFLDAGGFAG